MSIPVAIASFASKALLFMQHCSFGSFASFASFEVILVDLVHVAFVRNLLQRDVVFDVEVLQGFDEL